MKNETIDEGFNYNKLIVFAIIGIILLIALFGSFYIINPGERGILITLGNPSPVASAEGLHFKIPIIQHVVKMDIKTQKYDAQASGASKDLQIVSTNIAVNYHLSSDGVVSLYKDIGVGYKDKLIMPFVQEVVKANTAKFTAEELITKREVIKEMIDADLRERLEGRGIYMETTSITNFDFSAQFNQAIEAKVTAEQNALTEKNRLAQIEYQAQQKVAEANGTATATILNAQASAQSILLKATSDAEALRLQKEQVTPELIQLRMAEKWDGALPQYMFGDSMPLLQLPVTN